MRAISIPIVPIGPGTQSAGDEALSYQPLPRMETFSMPRLPEDGRAENFSRAAEALERFLDLAGSGRPASVGLESLPAEVRAVLNTSLGQGDVSVIVRGADGALTRAQETAFTGIWRVRIHDRDDHPVSDVLESGAMPACLARAIESQPVGAVEPCPRQPGLMNAPSLLREIAFRAARWTPGSAPHVINLTLLPTTPEDLAALAACLGEGPARLLSRGFGNCRVTSARARGLWRVQYFNSMDTLILDTIEFTSLPDAARAADEDLAESLERLRELLDWLGDLAAEQA